MEAPCNQKLFHKRIRRQRISSTHKLSELIINDIHISEEDEIREGWADYFSKLSQPTCNDSYDKYFQKLTKLDRLLIQHILGTNAKNPEYFTQEEVSDTIRSLKLSKAADGQSSSSTVVLIWLQNFWILCWINV